MKPEAEFLKEFNIPSEDFKKTKLSWSDLTKIYSDYSKSKDLHLPTAKDVSERLLQCSSIHSVKYRLKDPDHLIAKIIRKKIDNPKLNFQLDNYSELITDIVGVRALHLFKEDWKPIDKAIKETWHFAEKPTANIRGGDNKAMTKAFKDAGCKINEHKDGYRSVHYLIKYPLSKKTHTVVEIQVRTIFEEGWSEIDHKIRYPNNTKNLVLSGYLNVFNRLAGNADEMGNFLLDFQREVAANELVLKKKESEISELNNQIKGLKIDKEEKRKLQEKIDRLSEENVTYLNGTTFNPLLFGTVQPFQAIHHLNAGASWSYSPQAVKICKNCNLPYTPSIVYADNGYCERCPHFQLGR
jgi:putative GTP pyrophosphokinase